MNFGLSIDFKRVYQIKAHKAESEIKNMQKNVGVFLLAGLLFVIDIADFTKFFAKLYLNLEKLSSPYEQ